jgi:hypothetical protein
MKLTFFVQHEHGPYPRPSPEAMRDGGGFHPRVGHFREEPHARGEILNAARKMQKTSKCWGAQENSITYIYICIYMFCYILVVSIYVYIYM